MHIYQATRFHSTADRDIQFDSRKILKARTTTLSRSSTHTNDVLRHIQGVPFGTCRWMLGRRSWQVLGPVTVRAMNACGGGGGEWTSRSGSFTSGEMAPNYLWIGTLGGPQRRSRRFGQEQKLLPAPACCEQHVYSHAAGHYVTVYIFFRFGWNEIQEMVRKFYWVIAQCESAVDDILYIRA
jgi:hypothetical protein